MTEGKAGGCRRQRFEVGDGGIDVVDEWDTAERFQAFISSPDIQQASLASFADAKGFPGEF